ncbi:MAG TPA: sterol desaturase family protein [Cyclobacteriaceae bacterium]|nr:sterol desaturase family protein [Cyclobacteriaceae bacterium]
MAETLYVPKNEGTKVMFKSKFLERLTRTHISIPLILLNIYSAASLYWALTRTNASGLSLTGMFFGGMLFWTFFEYIVHRFVWHMDTDTDYKKKLQYKLHGVHHEYPRDKDRLALPIPMSLTIATILLFLFRFIFGSSGFGFFSGFATTYTIYLSIHYIVHAYQPPKNFLKFLWINHGIHHYKDDDHAFGVSSPLWDYIFRTMPSRRK